MDAGGPIAVKRKRGRPPIPLEEDQDQRLLILAHSILRASKPSSERPLWAALTRQCIRRLRDSKIDRAALARRRSYGDRGIDRVALVLLGVMLESARAGTPYGDPGRLAALEDHFAEINARPPRGPKVWPDNPTLVTQPAYLEHVRRRVAELPAMYREAKLERKALSHAQREFEIPKIEGGTELSGKAATLRQKYKRLIGRPDGLAELDRLATQYAVKGVRWFLR